MTSYRVQVAFQKEERPLKSSALELSLHRVDDRGLECFLVMAWEFKTSRIVDLEEKH